MGNPTVAFIAYPVSDIARSVAFYSDVMRLAKTSFANENWVEFDVAGVTFGVGNFPQIGTPGSAQSLALEVEDLAAFRTTLSEHRTTSTEPFETPICRISVANDPDGNHIILHQAKAKANS
ncbi:MAG: VOC family protein [Candidatus Eremiobacteraeota bacterium]|nr:VOC family protein [Candidatus Eremiobacteraeota bacterium]